jgi:hypothetical protein
MLAVAIARLRTAWPSADAGSSDVTVTILFAILSPLVLGESSIVTAIANPGPGPALVGLSVRRQRGPAWLGNRTRAAIARRTTRRRYRADRQAIIGIVPAAETSLLPVHFTASRGRYRIVAVIGQPDHRLRVISMPFAQPARGIGQPHTLTVA